MSLAAILFVVAAAAGIAIAIMRLSGHDFPPVWLALLHGAFAASGLVALALAVFQSTVPDWAKYALGGFAVAAAGGFILASFHRRRKALPIPLMAIHAAVAAVSLVMLVVAIFNHA